MKRSGARVSLFNLFEHAPRARARTTRVRWGPLTITTNRRARPRFGFRTARGDLFVERYRRPALAALGVAAAGIAWRVLYDPAKGLNRRQRLAGLVRRTRRRAGHRLAAELTDLGNRLRGFMVEVWPVRTDIPDDAVLESRVQAELGHAVRHPHVEVHAHRGHVVLSGRAAVEDAEKLLKRARRVRGVAGVENRIEGGSS